MHPLTTLSAIEEESLNLYDWYMRTTYPPGRFFVAMHRINFRGRHEMVCRYDKQISWLVSEGWSIPALNKRREILCSSYFNFPIKRLK